MKQLSGCGSSHGWWKCRCRKEESLKLRNFFLPLRCGLICARANRAKCLRREQPYSAALSTNPLRTSDPKSPVSANGGSAGSREIIAPY